MYWVVGLVLITIILSGTVIWINHNSWTIRFEMDDNTKEAVESIGWEGMEMDKEYAEDYCYYPASCFVNDSEYLKQFPNEEVPEITCTYAMYCSRLNNFTWEDSAP